MLKKLPQKLVVELRFKPDLGFYGTMDSIGQELADEYPDWERSPLSVEVRNKKRHRRVFLSAGRAFVDIDEVEESDVSHTEKLLEKVFPRLGAKQFKRIGVRQWFAADLGKPFALMLDEFADRFLPKNPQLGSILNDKTKDVAYVIDCEVAEGWRYSLRLGPMTRSQWFLFVGYEMNVFEQGDEATETFERFRQSLPEQFLYIDIDCSKEDETADGCQKFFSSARRRSHELADKLIAYCKG